VQGFGTGSDRLFSASLDAGARRFQAPIPIDLNVGEATATFPSLSMNAGGAAYLCYRVLPSLATDPNLPAGYVDAETRIQRYDGSFWAALGQGADRNPSIPMRRPTAANTAKIAIDQQGNGAIAWQEPDEDFIERIWARRVFGQVLGIPLLVSPQRWNDRPLRGPADQFSLDVAGFGEVGVAFRQQPGDGTALKGTRVMVNSSPEAFSENAKAFPVPRIADGNGDAGPAVAPGPASVGVASNGSFLAAFGLGSATLGIDGTDEKVAALERLDDGTSTIPGDPLADVALDGAAVLAWKARVGGRSSVVVRERGSDGVSDTRPLSTPAAGPVSSLGLAGSGFGDGLVAFVQGQQNAGAVVDAPPSAFVVQTPIDWVKDRRIPVTWDPAVNAIGRVAYSVTVDDQVVAEGVRSTRLTLGPDELDDGVHSVAVVATDPGGQETTSSAGDLQVDRTAPAVTVTTKRRKVTVRVSDGPAKETSGLATKGTLISFGAGGKPVKGKAKAAFTYPRAGSFVITVKARDAVGNGGRSKRRVKVR
jgi:hypothetical protein